MARKYPLPEFGNDDLMNCEMCDAEVFECNSSGRCPNCAQYAERWEGLNCSACGEALSDALGAVRAPDGANGTFRAYCESCADEDEIDEVA